MEVDDVPLIPSGKVSLEVGDVTYRPTDSYSLTESDMKKAYVELNETDELRSACLTELRQRLSSDKNLNYRVDDAYLLRFLRVKKFDCDKAHKTIQGFYAVRHKHPEIFAIPSNLEALLDLEFYAYLPYEDQEGRVLYKVDFEKWNPSKVSFQEILSMMTVVTDISTLNPRVQVNGAVAVWDVKGMSPKHVAQFLNPWRLSLFFKILQGCYPWRIKIIIGVNCGPISRMFYKMVQPFVKTKVIERVILLGSDMSELHQHVNPDVLPKQFGGKLDDSECSSAKHVLNNMEYLNYERSFGCKNA